MSAVMNEQPLTEEERLTALTRPPWLSPDAPWQPGRPVPNPNPMGRRRRGPREEIRQLREGFTPDPVTWPDDGGAKRVAIYNHTFGQPRLVRRVGWVNCLSQYSLNRPHRFFSPDVQKVRMCATCRYVADNAHHSYRD